MLNSPVLWSEGMFLRPHHFQAADRFWGELIARNVHYDHPCGYGILRLVVKPQSLDNNVLELSGLAARMKDGALIESETGPLTIDLNVRLADTPSTEVVEVYLAIPEDSPEQGNTASAAGTTKRFIGFDRDIADEVRGENRQTVGARRFNYQILLSTDNRSGFHLLPLLRLIPAGAGTSKFRIDPNYFPPMLEIASWSELRELISELRNFLLGRIRTIGEIMVERGITLSSSIEGDAQKLWLMHCMNQAAAELECIAFAPGVHPLVAYTYLCSMVGRFSIFGEKKGFQGVPQYDHDNLAPIFRKVCEQIRSLVNSVKDDEVIQRNLIGSGRGMSVTLQPEWLGDDWEWYFGVRPLNFEPDKVPTLMGKGLVWVLGSAEMVEKYFTAREGGLTLAKVREVPRALLGRGNWVYFQIRTDNDAWRRVAVDFSVAMRIKEEQIANLSALNGSNRLLASIGGQTYALEFAVFAFKKRSSS